MPKVSFRNLAVAAAAIVFSGSAFAVDRLVPQQYQTIQAAIDASANGDVVQISPGVYPGPVDLKGKAVTVRGTSTDSASVISGGSDPGGIDSVVRCVTAESADTVLENLTITGGTRAWGAGLRLDAASPTIRNCRIIGNSVDLTEGGDGAGAGVYVRGGAPTILNCIIGANTITVRNATANGVGIYITDSLVTLYDCTITGNFLKTISTCCCNGTAGAGAGAYVGGTQASRFVRCTFSTNQLEVQQTCGNNGGYCGGAGVALYTAAPISLVNCRIKTNVNSGCGGSLGAVRFASNLASMSGCVFCENSCGNTNGPYLDLGGNRFLSSCPNCVSDLNSDGVVDGNDLGQLLSNWGPCTN
jgi:hypothetical protein